MESTPVRSTASDRQHLAKKDFVGEDKLPVRSVLVVDDSPAIRKIVCEIFASEEDFEVCGQAENGSEAIEKAQLLQPSVIVTDLYMPLMNGLEETRALKKLMPAVPVIMYSAHLDSFMEKELNEQGRPPL